MEVGRLRLLRELRPLSPAVKELVILEIKNDEILDIPLILVLKDIMS